MTTTKGKITICVVENINIDPPKSSTLTYIGYSTMLREPKILAYVNIVIIANHKKRLTKYFTFPHTKKVSKVQEDQRKSSKKEGYRVPRGLQS